MADQWGRPDLTVPPPTLDEIEQYTTDGKHYIQGSGNTWSTDNVRWSIYAPGRQRVPSPVPPSGEWSGEWYDAHDHALWIRYAIILEFRDKGTEATEKMIRSWSVPDQEIGWKLLDKLTIEQVDRELSK